MEEYMYEYIQSHTIDTDFVYLPIFWTNLQNHPGFKKQKESLQIILDEAIAKEPQQKYVVIVQHDDGPLLRIPKDTLILGACTGDVPLPLIYEDITERLLYTPRPPLSQKIHLASFVGTISTHPIRQEMKTILDQIPDIQCTSRKEWSEKVPHDNAMQFIQTTLQSRFCMSPRGYGRSSFRFFEAMLLDVVPVYVWDDVKWLPYPELDDSKFSISIQRKELPNLPQILQSITDEKYNEMVEEIKKVRHHFTLEGMAEWIKQYLELKLK
jgi:hypothetical protein